MKWLNKLFGHHSVDREATERSIAVHTKAAKATTIKALDMVEHSLKTEQKDEGLKEASAQLRASIGRLVDRMS